MVACALTSQALFMTLVSQSLGASWMHAIAYILWVLSIAIQGGVVVSIVLESTRGRS